MIGGPLNNWLDGVDFSLRYPFVGAASGRPLTTHIPILSIFHFGYLWDSISLDCRRGLKSERIEGKFTTLIEEFDRAHSIKSFYCYISCSMRTCAFPTIVCFRPSLFNLSSANPYVGTDISFPISCGTFIKPLRKF